MDYCLYKLIIENGYAITVGLMNGFESIQALMEKIQVIGLNLDDGTYIIGLCNRKTKQIRNKLLVIIVKNGCIKTMNPEEYLG